jgi:hypothetical protein
MNNGPSLAAVRRRVHIGLQRLLDGSRPELKELRGALFRVSALCSDLVVLGGYLRSHAMLGASASVRDLDLVADGVDLDVLEQELARYVVSRSRFGGLKLRVAGWRVDLWTLSSTWAIRAGYVKNCGMSSLLSSTFFNVEAMYARPIQWSELSKTVLRDKDALSAIASRTLAISLEENPFPALCVARTFHISTKMGFRLDQRLTEYVLQKVESHSIGEIQEAYHSHYPPNRWSLELFERWLDTLVSRSIHVLDRPLVQSAQLDLALEDDAVVERALREQTSKAL